MNIPHNYALCADVDEKDVWIGTSKGVAWGIGADYYAGLKPEKGETEARNAGGEE